MLADRVEQGIVKVGRGDFLLARARRVQSVPSRSLQVHVFLTPRDFNMAIQLKKRTTARDWDTRTHEEKKPGIGTHEEKQLGIGTQGPTTRGYGTLPHSEEKHELLSGVLQVAVSFLDLETATVTNVHTPVHVGRVFAFGLTSWRSTYC